MTKDNTTPNNLAAFCWSIADLLRGDFKQSQYGRIILPFTLLRRLEGVLEESKEAVLTKYEQVQKMNLSEEAQEKMLLRASGLSFFNTSKMDMSKLGETGIKANLESYIQGFSKDAREIFEYFNFAEFIGQLNDADLLWKVVKKVRSTDLSPKAISNHDMGLTFEELIRRFAEGSNETAGEHFTPVILCASPPPWYLWKMMTPSQNPVSSAPSTTPPRVPAASSPRVWNTCTS